MAADAFNAEDADGRVKMTLNDVRYVLRRPKIKEFRAIREQLIEIAKAAGATDDEAEDMARGRIDAAAIVEREDELFAWWAFVFATLEEKGQPFPEVDDLPVWIIGAEIVPAMMGTWLNRPAVPGR